MNRKQVSATKVIGTSPERIFTMLTDPSKHPLIEGTGSVLAVQPGGPERLTLGAQFGPVGQRGPVRSEENRRRWALPIQAWWTRRSARCSSGTRVPALSPACCRPGSRSASARRPARCATAAPCCCCRAAYAGWRPTSRTATTRRISSSTSWCRPGCLRWCPGGTPTCSAPRARRKAKTRPGSATTSKLRCPRRRSARCSPTGTGSSRPTWPPTAGQRCTAVSR